MNWNLFRKKKKCHRNSNDHVRVLSSNSFYLPNPSLNGLPILEHDRVKDSSSCRKSCNLYSPNDLPRRSQAESLMRTQSFTGGGWCRSDLGRRKELNNCFLKTADRVGSQPSFLWPLLDSALELAT